MASVCPSYTVRKATRADVASIKRMTEVEGWELDINFLYCMYDLDSRAWFVAETNAGEIIGVRALSYFKDQLATGGIYIVKEDLRGHGIGRAVNAAALSAIGDSNIIISATDMNIYTTRGFTHHYDIHLKRLNAGVMMDSLPVFELDMHVTIKQYTDAMLSDVINYDYDICKNERQDYTRKWTIQTAEVILVACSDDANIQGYGCLRMTEYGYQVAPLYANSNIIAWSLMKQLLEGVDRSKHVDLYVCSSNDTFMNLLNSVPHDQLVILHKMYTKRHAEIVLKKVYALSSISLSCV